MAPAAKTRVIDLGRKQTVREQERNILRRLVATLEKGLSSDVSIEFPVYLEQLNGAYQRASYLGDSVDGKGTIRWPAWWLRSTESTAICKTPLAELLGGSRVTPKEKHLRAELHLVS
jgi:hypothetical protein